MSDRLNSEELEPLDLPALALKFDYGGASLPIGLRYPTPSYSIHDPHPQEINFNTSKDLTSSLGSSYDSTDLKYKKRVSATIASPLYFRQTAKLHTPSPSSPPKQPYSPRFSPARPPSISRSQVSAFALPPAINSAFSSNNPLPISTNGLLPKKQRSSMSALADTRPDLLLSPRIRALRSAEIVISEEKENLEEEEAVEEETEGDDSAFTRYLFSQLAVTTPPVLKVGETERIGRPSAVGAMEEKRSLSVDSVFPAGRNNLSSTVRPTRFLFGRGTPSITSKRDALNSESNFTNSISSSISPISPPLSPSNESNQVPLTPGGFITATFDSASSSTVPSPFPSPPNSPPNLINRGRSDTRRTSDSSLTPPSLSNLPTKLNSVDPRGRSKLRTLASVQRDLSPIRNESNSGSRGRKVTSPSGLNEIRLTSGSRARDDNVKGRGRRDDEDDEEVGGRDGRGRSRSLVRASRGGVVAAR